MQQKYNEATGMVDTFSPWRDRARKAARMALGFVLPLDLLATALGTEMIQSNWERWPAWLQTSLYDLTQANYDVFVPHEPTFDVALAGVAFCVANRLLRKRA